MSRKRAAEVALVGVALVWGVTFVMVQDAVADPLPGSELACDDRAEQGLVSVGGKGAAFDRLQHTANISVDRF